MSSTILQLLPFCRTAATCFLASLRIETPCLASKQASLKLLASCRHQ